MKNGCVRKKTYFYNWHTGFIGRWLLASLCYVNAKFQLDVKVVLSRNTAKANQILATWTVRLSLIYLKAMWLTKLELSKNLTLSFTATDVENPLDGFDTLDVCIRGTKNVMELAERAEAKEFLLKVLVQVRFSRYFQSRF